MTMKFPFVEDTLGKKLEAGTGMSVDCLTCRRHVVLDVAALVERLGPGQPCLHWDLVKVIFCHECRAAGRDDRNLLTNHAATPDKRKGWAMKRERPGRLAWVGQQTPGLTGAGFGGERGAGCRNNTLLPK